VPLNSAESPDDKKTSAEEKDYDLGFGRVAICNTRIRLPEAGRRSQASSSVRLTTSGHNQFVVSCGPKKTGK
jgi:hypothetical protein